METVGFRTKPGFMLDLFFLFAMHFNREDCLTRFINYSKSREDTDYYSNVLREVPPISDELLLFFRLSDDKKCLMTRRYYEPYADRFVSDAYDVSVILDVLSDRERVIEYVIRDYFRNIAEEAVSQCKTSLSLVSTLIKESDYSGEVKSALYSFFIEPHAVIHRLACELKEKGEFLSKAYKEAAQKQRLLRETFDLQFLIKGLEKNDCHKADLRCFDKVEVSFCLFHKNCIKTYFYDGRALVILGADYVDQLAFLAVQNQMPELESFGTAVSEPNRVDILNLMLQREEVTIKDLEQEFGMTGTNAYYHLSLMTKSGMVKMRNRGRTVLYSIKNTFFELIDKSQKNLDFY